MEGLKKLPVNYRGVFSNVFPGHYGFSKSLKALRH